jgi:hypothetical protein
MSDIVDATTAGDPSMASEGGRVAPGPIIAVLAGGRADDEVLELASLLREGAKTPVLALWVIEVPRSLPLRHYQQAPIDRDLVERARRLAGSRGLDFHMTWGRGRGSAVLEEVRQADARGIVLGVSPDSNSSELLEDWQVSLLRKAPCRVWLVRASGPDAFGKSYDPHAVMAIS